MLLRHYQTDFVNKALDALKNKGRTLGIVPTGGQDDPAFKNCRRVIS